MGSRGPEPEERTDDIHVLVTGFGPFRDNPINPSHLIAQSLPPLLPPSTPSSHPPIHIHPHPSPLRVSYPTIRATLPALIFPPPAPDRAPAAAADRPAYDLVLLIGMAPGRHYFTLETVARRDGYTKEDVDGGTMAGDGYWRDEVGAPETLGPKWGGGEGGWEAEVLRRWRAGVRDGDDVRRSSDAGRYLCDFTFYTALVEYWRRDPGGERPVVFLHVPGRVGEGDVLRGRRVAVALVRALVESWGRGEKAGKVEGGLEGVEM